VIDILDNSLIDIQAGNLPDLPTAFQLSPIIYVMPFVTALVVSMAMIPLMIRIAPGLGMLDLPDRRKVHALPVPRVGGVGIVFGTLVSIGIWLEFDPVVMSFVLGALVLLVFGVWDDIADIGYVLKFAGQILAVMCVVYLGDVYIRYLPFFGVDPVSGWFGRPFTVFVLVGVINALNTSDGLDGLAGGEFLLSMTCLVYLTYVSGGAEVLVMATAGIGGVLGFLRYNSHPAQIFMGDSGSQFLGYTLGFLALLFTQKVNTATSPLIALFIVGLPLIDLLYVIIQRSYAGLSWFRPTKSHIHHRLLNFGLHHYESVVVIYFVQVFVVSMAILMRYESDALILAVYASISIIIYLLIGVAMARGWHTHRKSGDIYFGRIVTFFVRNQWLSDRVYDVIFYSMSLYLVAGALLATEIPADFGEISAVLGLVLLVGFMFGRRFRILFMMRPLVYITTAYIVYLGNIYQPEYLEGADPFTYIFFGIIIAGIIYLVRFSGQDVFRASPMDFLVILIVIALSIFASIGALDAQTTSIILKITILFYGSELILNRARKQWNFFTGCVLASLMITSYRGLSVLVS